MNNIVVEGGGFPTTSNTLRFFDHMIKEIHKITALGGVDYIASGVVVTNNVATDGVIVFNGEILPFTGGSVQNKVVIRENIQNQAYLKDENNDGQGDIIATYFTRYAEFLPNGQTTTDVNFEFVGLQRIKPLTELTRRVTPKKAALPFWGALNEIPEGWQLCDGTSGTPDLRGLFIVGYNPAETDYNAIGKQGGQKEVTLNENQMPSHNHNGTTFNAGAHTHSGATSYDGAHSHRVTADSDFGGVHTTLGLGGGNSNDKNIYTNSTGAHSHSLNISQSGNHIHSFTTNNKGSDQAHENRPPYYVMAYITYVG